MSVSGIQGSGAPTCSQSVPLASRMSVKPSDPGYDAHVLAHIKTKVLVAPVTGCWLWQGAVAEVKWNERGFRTGGYGYIGYRGRNISVHRVVWMIHNGPQPKKMDVCHDCDVRHCCNLDHLWLGTRKQNLQDMADKRRGLCGEKAAQTECLRGHELSGDNVRLSNGGRRRNCKICERGLKRIAVGWPEDLAYSLPPQPLGYRPFPCYVERQPWEGAK